MLADYGKHVQNVDAAMTAWKQQQNDKLEDRLRQRRLKRQQEAED